MLNFFKNTCSFNKGLVLVIIIISFIFPYLDFFVVGVVHCTRMPGFKKIKTVLGVGYLNSVPYYSHGCIDDTLAQRQLNNIFENFHSIDIHTVKYLFRNPSFNHPKLNLIFDHPHFMFGSLNLDDQYYINLFNS